MSEYIQVSEADMKKLQRNKNNLRNHAFFNNARVKAILSKYYNEHTHRVYLYETETGHLWVYEKSKTGARQSLK